MNILVKKIIKNSEDVNNPKVRESYGKFAGIFVICINFILFGLKFTLGLIFGCISITADAINNLTDMASSIITLLGFKLAAKKPDKEHPFGHERIEYITALFVAVIILVIGIELGKSSFDKVIHPVENEFSYIIVIVLSIAILLKIYQCIFIYKMGKKINSIALIATSHDARNDAISTFFVLLGLIISYLIGYNLDAYFGLLVSLFVIVSGLKLIKETIDPLIGVSPDKELVDKIVSKAISYKEIYGIHDLVCHMYGASKLFITMHCEVDSRIPIIESHELIDLVEREIKEEFNCEITIHLDPVEIGNPIVDETKEAVKKIISEIDSNLVFHDFRMVVGEKQTNLIFDVVIPFDFQISESDLTSRIQGDIEKINPCYKCVITYDKDYVG